ncbi:ParA family protein [Staphylococcus epidermidis]|nr:ParA family protein [Staphylococcus epidermidis]MBO1996676.1 ParA family protein [Staphylococcus epidermidis]
MIFISNYNSKSVKGGVDKSTITKNLTTYLAIDQNKRVLNIDEDYSLYLTTNLYDLYENQGNIGEWFTLDDDGSKDVNYYTIHPNIDLVVGDPHLNDKIKNLTNEEGTTFILMKWLINHLEKLSVYDYLLIDTHNDFDTFTKMQLLLAMLY